MIGNSNSGSGNSKTLPIRKFAQFNNNFEILEKQQKQIDKLQLQQQQQQQQLQHSQIASKNHEFINPFPYYKNFAPSSAINKHNTNLSNYVTQHQSSHQRHYVQNRNFKNRNHLLLHKLESSLLNKNSPYNETYAQNANNLSANKNNSDLKYANNNCANNNNKRRSTQVYNL